MEERFWKFTQIVPFIVLQQTVGSEQYMKPGLENYAFHVEADIMLWFEKGDFGTYEENLSSIHQTATYFSHSMNWVS